MRAELSKLERPGSWEPHAHPACGPPPRPTKGFHVNAIRGALAMVLFAGANLASGQQLVGVVEDPCALLSPVPAEVEAYRNKVAEAKAKQTSRPALTPSYLATHTEWVNRRLLQDFNGLCRYRDENVKLEPATEKRVVFFGDSITELWEPADPAFFANDRLNRGISGQTTAQMLGRFQHDVVALRPRVVHIMAGTNDIAGNTGPTTLPWIQANLRSMVELAKAHRISVVLAAVPPAAQFNWRPSVQPAGQIRALNAWIKAYAESEKLVFVDYGMVLDDGRQGIKAELSADGVHPNPTAYERMRPLAESAVNKASAR
jgi:acyl-CoA thioesterase I